MTDTDIEQFRRLLQTVNPAALTVDDRLALLRLLWGVVAVAAPAVGGMLAGLGGGELVAVTTGRIFQLIPHLAN